jgi:hypothetical protein
MGGGRRKRGEETAQSRLLGSTRAYLHGPSSGPDFFFTHFFGNFLFFLYVSPSQIFYSSFIKKKTILLDFISISSP